MKYFALHPSNGQVYLWNKPRSNLNIHIESPYATSYLMAIVRIALPVIIFFEIVTVEVYMTLTLTFRMNQGQI